MRRNLFFFEAVLFDAVPAVLDEIEHAARRPARAAGAVLRLAGPAATWTATPRSAPTRWRARCSCTAAPRCGCCATRVDRLAQAFSHSSLRVPMSQELEDSLDARTPRSCRARSCCAARTASGSRCAPSSASSTTGSSNTLRPRGREPGLRRRAGAAARPRARARPPELAPRRARGDPAAAVAGRRVRLPPRRDRHPPGRGRRARGGRARCCRASPTPTSRAGQALLTEALVSGRRGIQHDPGGEAGELLRVLDTVALSAEAYGPQAVPGVRDLDDRAAVGRARRALARAARAGDVAADGAAVRDARRRSKQAPATMAELYACEPYLAHLRTQANRQTVMVGYSDSGKDTGYVASHVGAVQRAGAARGAGDGGRRRARALPRPRRLAVARRRAHLPGDPAPSPRGRSNGRIRITEQGETVSARYADPELAAALAGADGLGRAAGQRAAEPAGQAPSGARRWSGSRWRSRERYRALVYDDPEFLRFFNEVAPIAELSQLNIGSRPPSRRGSSDVESLRAIPWVFAWTQNRLLLPSWYGAGDVARAPATWSMQREMWRDWPFFTRADRDARDGAVQDRPRCRRALHDARRRRHRRRASGTTCGPSTRASSSACWTITGQERLLDETPALQARLEHRNPWIDPLSHLQVELLRRLRAGREEARAPLLATITGIAAGMRNTG